MNKLNIDKHTSKNFQLGNIITISFSHLVNDVYSSFLSPLLPLLVKKYGITLSLAGMLNLFQQIPALFQPFVGILSEKIPARFLLIFAPSITAISMSLLGTANDYGALIIIVIFAGVGSTLFHVPGSVMVKRISGERIGKGMSFFMLGGELARSLGPMLVLGAVEFWSLEETYKLIPIGLTATVLLFFRFRKIRITEELRKSKESISYFGVIKKHSGLFVQIAGIFFFSAIMRGALSAFLPVYLVEKGNSLWFGGIALSVFQLSGAVGTFLSGTISDKIGRRNVLFLILAISPVLMFVFVFSSGILSFALLVLMGLSMFGITPVMLALINEIDSYHISFINGVFMTINFLSGSFGILIVGFLGDLFSLTNAFTISPLIGILALPFIFMIKENSKRK